MPPKRNAAASANTSQNTAARPITPTPAQQVAATPKSKSKGGSLNAGEVAGSIWQKYVNNTPQRTKLIDVFMAFLVAVGILQFVYCVIVGNYPFNAFLSGFSATVGQFVLTASLRIQTSAENAKEFNSISPERAFADYVFGSLILHFFCVNFIN